MNENTILIIALTCIFGPPLILLLFGLIGIALMAILEKVISKW